MIGSMRLSSLLVSGCFAVAAGCVSDAGPGGGTSASTSATAAAGDGDGDGATNSRGLGAAAPTGDKPPCAPPRIHRQVDVKDAKRLGRIVVQVDKDSFVTVTTQQPGAPQATTKSAAPVVEAELDKHLKSQLSESLCRLGGHALTFAEEAQAIGLDLKTRPLSFDLDVLYFGPPNERADLETICDSPRRSAALAIQGVTPSQIAAIAQGYLEGRMTSARWAKWLAEGREKAPEVRAGELELAVGEAGIGRCGLAGVLREGG